MTPLATHPSPAPASGHQRRWRYLRGLPTAKRALSPLIGA